MIGDLGAGRSGSPLEQLVSEVAALTTRLASLEADVARRLPRGVRIVYDGTQYLIQRDDTGASAPLGI